ncbi:unnamed protein product [Acanthocheilonema viteae]|uniref:Uncharacterized protein n=1 Tax=Acanthocheilonema viteae TaxID=6277 RepID=A0A498T092_ACAVI|nr:unnamed protein product [Acanthocheilonema viteae]
MQSSEYSAKVTTISDFVERKYSPSLNNYHFEYTLLRLLVGTDQSRNWPNRRDWLWCQIYSLGLTRAKHAFFDEFNVLETYQPRARTMGHLFMPEPPTPVPDAQRQQLNATKETERNAFLQMRDAHYGNEYTYVEKVNRELKEGGNLAKQSQNEVKNGISDTPKIEGPILIEFHADSESDDDDYSI